MKSKKSMVEFLAGHFRYNTTNSWNRSTSYAANVKINRFVPAALINKAYELLDLPETFDGINFLVEEFGRAHGWQWQAGFNGRSGGYIVLYRGEAKPSEYKSYCTACGQKNFTRIEENSAKCGVCQELKRVNYSTPPLQISTFPGKGVDDETDFSEWDIETLRDRVKTVREFDALIKACKAEFLDVCERFNVEEREILVSKKVKRLVEK